MTTTLLSPPPGLPPGSDRLVSTRVNGVGVLVPCFDWCTVAHHPEDTRFVEDVNHIGESVEVAVSHASGAVEDVFTAQLFAYPHCGADTKVSIDLGGDCIELDAEQAEAFADQLITAASKLRGLARVIAGAR